MCIKLSFRRRPGSIYPWHGTRPIAEWVPACAGMTAVSKSRIVSSIQPANIQDVFMKKPEKIRVAVLYGGRSSEHEVSVQSATNVIQHLDPSRFDVIPIGIDKQGKWFLGKEVFIKSIADKQVCKLNDSSQTWFAPEWIGNPSDRQQFKELMTPTHGPLFDVVFPAVHGTLCEDGTLQGLLEIADLPYVGCGVLASALGMDKDVSKRLAMLAGIPVPPYLVLRKDQWHEQTEFYVNHIENKLGYPVFCKPANTGSSIGISKVKSRDQLHAAVDLAFKFDTKILIEQGLNIIELEVAVLESLQPNREPIVSIVGEIRSTHEFYSYDAKYIDQQGATSFIPAPISDELQLEAQKIAKQLFLTLECEGMARIDLFLTKDTKQIYFNEINTLPGFTQISMYPKLMQASGVSYSDLLTHLIELAIKRHKNKNSLARSYD